MKPTFSPQSDASAAGSGDAAIWRHDECVRRLPPPAAAAAGKSGT